MRVVDNGSVMMTAWGDVAFRALLCAGETCGWATQAGTNEASRRGARKTQRDVRHARVLSSADDEDDVDTTSIPVWRLVWMQYRGQLFIEEDCTFYDLKMEL